MVPKKFEDFCLDCDSIGASPISRLRRRHHDQLDRVYDTVEAKYSTGRDGKSWADLAHEVYHDMERGYDELSKVAADWYYGN